MSYFILARSLGTKIAVGTLLIGLIISSSIAQPDLIVTNVGWSPANPAPGDIVRFQAVVKNQGSVATPGSSWIGVPFWVDGNVTSWASGPTQPLLPGESISLTAFDGPGGASTWTATAGNHTVLAMADDAGRIPESNDNNNQLSVPLAVGGGGGGETSLPDLIVTNISWSPAIPQVGDSVRFQAVVKNQGPVATPGSSWIGVPFWVDGNVIGWASGPTQSLLPGNSILLTAFDGPGGASTWTATAGNHTVLAMADDASRIPESNDNNNQLSVPLAVGGGGGGETSLPDLIVTNISWSPAIPQVGDSVRFQAVVKNQGSVATPGSSWIGVPFWVDGNVIGWASGPTQSLLPGNSILLTAFDGPGGASTWTATAGNHTVLAMADDASRIPESNDNNNQLSVPLAVGNGDGSPSLGSWSPVYKLIPPAYNTDEEHKGYFVPIHLALLPNGRLMGWSRDAGIGQDGLPYDANAPCNPSVVFLWDPNTPTTSPTVLDPSVTNTGMTDCVFCGSHSLMGDGRLMVAGGHTGNGDGLNATYFFDYRTNIWQKSSQLMNDKRWYPTTTTLLDGRVIVAGGTTTGYNFNPIVQIWETNAPTPHWTTLTGFTMSGYTSWSFYPWLFPTPNGKVFWAGPQPVAGYIDVSGSGSYPAGGWTARTHFNAQRSYGSAVQYEPGKIFIVGGWVADTGIPTDTAEIIDLTSNSPHWQTTSSMHFHRGYCNATVLPDGTILITGGTSGDLSNNNNYTGAVLAAELWDPATGQMTVLSSEQVPRLYHSNAALLPDGRVAVGGGGLWPYGIVNGPPYNVVGAHPNIEIFTPPYLLKGGTRPSISSAPKSVAFGQTFSVQTPSAASITGVTLIRLSSTTHSFNMGQNFMRLTFNSAGGALNVVAPSNSITPPGDYLLFILDANKIPSVGAFISVR